jgi:hypothetical protein
VGIKNHQPKRLALLEKADKARFDRLRGSEPLQGARPDLPSTGDGSKLTSAAGDASGRRPFPMMETGAKSQQLSGTSAGGSSGPG